MGAAQGSRRDGGRSSAGGVVIGTSRPASTAKGDHGLPKCPREPPPPPPQEDQAPPQFLCPISLELMRDPVLTETGQTYERRNIQAWFSRGNRTDPMTLLTLRNTRLRHNHARAARIRDWLRRVAAQKQKEAKRAKIGSTSVVISRSGVGVTSKTKLSGVSERRKQPERKPQFLWLRCGVCTYKNPPKTARCELCNTDLSKNSAPARQPTPPGPKSELDERLRVAAANENRLVNEKRLQTERSRIASLLSRGPVERKARVHPASHGVKIACIACTYLNPPSARVCGVCSSDLPTRGPPENHNVVPFLPVAMQNAGVSGPSTRTDGKNATTRPDEIGIYAWSVQDVEIFVSNMASSHGSVWREYAEGLAEEGVDGPVLLKFLDLNEAMQFGFGMDDAKVLSRALHGELAKR